MEGQGKSDRPNWSGNKFIFCCFCTRIYQLSICSEYLPRQQCQLSSVKSSNARHCLLAKITDALCETKAMTRERGTERKKEAFLPVRVIMMRTANTSGYPAKTPGAFMDMYSLQNCSMRFPTNSSKVALHARATLEVPEMEKEQLRWISWRVTFSQLCHPALLLLYPLILFLYLQGNTNNKTETKQ